MAKRIDKNEKRRNDQFARLKAAEKNVANLEKLLLAAVTAGRGKRDLISLRRELLEAVDGEIGEKITMRSLMDESGTLASVFSFSWPVVADSVDLRRAS